jgi:hypothetical protein
MVPAAHLILYVITMILIVPSLLAAGWRNERADAALLASLGVLSVAMMPGALGRCDPPHVLFYGLIVSLLLMVRLAGVSRGAHFVCSSPPSCRVTRTSPSGSNLTFGALA